MDLLQNIIEYYDELYPIGAEHKEFFESILPDYQLPAKILRIGCATGNLEHYLARLGHDVTGIDSLNDFIDLAALRSRSLNASIRFFHMTPTEMSRFLGKRFYNIISSLEGNFYLIHDATLRRKFFYDCRNLLSDDGCLIIHIPDMTATRESLRVTLYSQINQSTQTPDGNAYTLTQELSRGNGKRIPVRAATPIAQPTYSEIEQLAHEAGFTSIKGFSEYSLTPCADVNNATLFLIK